MARTGAGGGELFPGPPRERPRPVTLGELQPLAERVASRGPLISASRRGAQVDQRVYVLEPRRRRAADPHRFREQVDDPRSLRGERQDAQVADHHARQPSLAGELELLLGERARPPTLAKRQSRQCGGRAPGDDPRPHDAPLARG